MNKKAISILLTAAMGVSVLAAGTVTVSAAEKKDKYVIGMSQCNLGEPWRVAMNDQIAMAAEKHPEFEVIFADAAQDNSKQIADIENFVQMGVDLIITSPNEATPLTNAVSAAYDAGIPVILLDRKIDGDKYTQFIGADNVDMGRIAGEYVADTLLPDGGKVCEIKGLEGTSGGIDRDNGFREGIKKNDKIEIVAVNNADWLREKAITVAEEMLQTNDEIDLFLHPHWQQHVLQDLQNAFPRMQFIVTTHSPFIVQSVDSQNVIALDSQNAPISPNNRGICLLYTSPSPRDTR